MKLEIHYNEGYLCKAPNRPSVSSGFLKFAFQIQNDLQIHH